MEDQKADIQDQQRKSYLRSLDVLTHPESALILSFDTNAPNNVMPHYPPPGQCWGIGGDLNFAKFKCTTYRACQSAKS